MPDLDLAAIRAKHAKWLNQRLLASELLRREADDATIAAAENVCVRLADTTLVHLPALLDELDQTYAELRQLADRLREAVAERDRLRVSRDDWRTKALGAASMQRFVIGGDCREPGCRGQRVEIAAFGRADPVAVVLDCGHELPEAVRAPESPQNPPTQPEPHGRPERP